MGNPTLLSVAADRQIAVGQFGAPDGYPVFFMHGALASWRYRHPDDRIAASLGVRLITTARPGFGSSTRNKGRTVSMWANDVAAIADALDIDRFAVLGHSGGGPHALACAAVLGGRVTAVGAAGSPAPLDSEERLATMGAGGAVFQTATTTPIAEFEEGLGRIAELMSANIEMAIRGSFGTEAVPDVPGLIEMMLEDSGDVFVQGAAGWADEVHALAHDWGFALVPTTSPVSLFYGEDDALLPHGEALAAAFGSKVTTHPGGHMAFFAVWEQALRQITP